MPSEGGNQPSDALGVYHGKDPPKETADDKETVVKQEAWTQQESGSSRRQKVE